MAHPISDFTRAVAAGGDYPYGDIKDVPGGTLVNRTMLTDLVQTVQRAMALAGITPNGDDDNDANGYQVAQALGLEAWTTANNVAIVANTAPTGSMSAVTYAYNKYKLVGKTLHWQMRLTGVTIAGSPTSFNIDAPDDIAALGIDWQNNSFKSIGIINSTATLLVTLGGGTGTCQLTISLVGGGAFTNAGSQTIELNVVAEIG